MHRKVRVTAPSRLHFGLLRFARPTGRSYGGLGMMIAEPRTVVELSCAARWQASGANSDLALRFAQMAVKQLDQSIEAAVDLRILARPEPHSGLGSGTQLALSVATGVHALSGDGSFDLEEIVAATGRGQRSSVGSFGFQLGGLIWEYGKLPQQILGELVCRAEVPETWRVVLIRFPGEGGLYGEHERQAFGSLSPVKESVTQQLIDLAENRILPAIADNQFEDFAEGIFQYGLLAGSCFTSIQGSPFVSQKVEQAVLRLREKGIRGVGQSSWGPTIFAFCADQDAAAEWVANLRQDSHFASAKMTISAPSNAGVRVEMLSEVLQ